MPTVNPLISVVMPVFNGETFLSAAIYSILSQSYSKIELIVINDGSTDSSEDIILSQTDKRIKYMKNPVNKGLVYSLNYGITSCNGKYIARMDADDIANPDRLEKQVRFMESNQNYGMIGTCYQVVDSKGKFLNNVKLPLSASDCSTSILFSNCFCHSTVMFRASLVQQLKYQDEYFLIEDYELWYNISRVTKTGNISDYSILYRIHGNNISIGKKNQMLLQLHKMNFRILSDLKITFSEDQLALHTNFLAFNFEYFKNEGQFKDLKNWILNLYKELSVHQALNSRVMSSIFSDRWLALCFNSKRYADILSFKIFSSLGLSYLRSLLGKIARRTSITPLLGV